MTELKQQVAEARDTLAGADALMWALWAVNALLAASIVAAVVTAV